MNDDATPAKVRLTDGLGPAPERARVCPLQECRGRPRCSQCRMLDEMYPPQRNLSGRGDAPAVAASPEERALTAAVFEALDLSPEQFLTDGGLVNRGKLRAAFWYPHEYLPEGHWMRAADEGRLRAENARLAREAHTWWTAARDAAKAERARCALRVALHSQYPITTDFDRGYDKARKDAAETLRTMGDEAGLELGPNVELSGPKGLRRSSHES